MRIIMFQKTKNEIRSQKAEQREKTRKEIELKIIDRDGDR